MHVGVKTAQWQPACLISWLLLGSVLSFACSGKRQAERPAAEPPADVKPEGSTFNDAADGTAGCGSGDAAGSASAADPADIPHQDCVNACRWVESCKPGTEEACLKACEAVVLNDGSHCLARHIGWINEEGCPTIVPAYASFNPANDCRETPPVDPDP